jgi:hypothetical protein
MATRTIGSVTGQDVDLATWAGGLSPNPSATEIGNIVDNEDVGVATISTSNSNSVEIKVTVASGIRYTADSNWPVMATAGAASARIVTTSAANIDVQTNDVTIEYLYLENTNSTGYCVSGTSSASNLTVRFCVMEGTGTSTGCVFVNTGSGHVFHHLAMWGSGATSFGIRLRSGASGSSYACAAYGMGANFWQQNNGTTHYAENCVGIDAQVSDFYVTAGATGFTGDYCGSTDSSASSYFTNNWTSLSSTWFDAVSSTAWDLHKASDGTHEGTDLSGTIGSTDIDGDTRSDWDIGVDEYIAGATSIPIFMHHYKQMAGSQ